MARSRSRSRAGATRSRSSQPASRRRQHPGRAEIGNTWAPTFTTAGAFSDLSGIYDDLGGEDLLQSFVDVGSVDGAEYALPYYFGSRYITYRKDIWDAAGMTVPTTLDEFNSDVKELKKDGQAGFYIGGQDWRNGISWIFANGGDLAKKDGDKWVSTLADPKSIEGLTQFQDLFMNASTAPVTEADSTPWVNINNDKSGSPSHRRHDHRSRMGALVDRRLQGGEDQ